MKVRKSIPLLRRENRLVYRIKSSYPHLYGALGGRYIREVLRLTDGKLQQNSKGISGSI